MRPILRGDRGSAVEDVQRRLRLLGADLGPTGIDGVFLGATLAAVRAFQAEHGLTEDGRVGPETWSALVDATFALGDRLLYLRFPYLHGADVRTLQAALNSLGFAAGDCDGIFGPFAERAVREFQRNAGLPGDGIAGPDTVRALCNLRHVWADKGSEALPALRRAPARDAATLARTHIRILALDRAGAAIAHRLENLAKASAPGADVRVTGAAKAEPGGLLLRLGGDQAAASDGVPTVAAGDGGDALAARIETALGSTGTMPSVIDVVVGEGDDELVQQRVAVGLLDGLCLGLAASPPPVVP